MDQSNEYKHYWKIIIKERAVRALGGRCTYCKKSFPTTVYDLHHVDESKKTLSFTKTSINGAKSWYKIRDELKKIALLCPSCHMMLHRGYITIDDKKYFDEEFYEWELAEERKIKKDVVKQMAEQIENTNHQLAKEIF